MSDVAHDYADEQKYEKMLVNLNVIYWMSIFNKICMYCKKYCVIQNKAVHLRPNYSHGFDDFHIARIR